MIGAPCRLGQKRLRKGVRFPGDRFFPRIVPLVSPEARANVQSSESAFGPHETDDDLERGVAHIARQPLRSKASDKRRNLFLFCSTVVDKRRTIILVIEPLSQSDRANSNSCFSD
jgi:hypothetical protein